MIDKRLYLFACVLACLAMNIHAQSTYSPYSMLGLGEIENRDYGRTSGMSNIGIGIREYDYLNTVNPSAISSMDSMKMIFDVSAAGKQSYYSGRGAGDKAFNGNFKKVAMGFRAARGWGISIGFRPFSDMGYQIYSEQPVDGSTGTKSVYLEGSGCIYEVYFLNGVRVTDFLSVGINTKFISGTLKQTENQGEYLFEKESTTSQVYNTLGIQFHKKLWTVGLTYGYKQKLSMTNKTLIYDSSYSLIEEQKERSSSQFIPETMGVGVSRNGKKLMWGIDFEYQKWKGLDSGVSSTKIVNSYRLNAGLGYAPNGYYQLRRNGQIQAGASLAKSYIQIGGKDAYNYSVSAGYCLPAKRGSLFTIGLEYGNVLSAPASYIKESYVMMTLNCSFIERWFSRIRIQ